MLSQMSVTGMPPAAAPRRSAARPGAAAASRRRRRWKRRPCSGRREQHGQGRAVLRRRQSAGVAVGQHALPLGDQGGTRPRRWPGTCGDPRPRWPVPRRATRPSAILETRSLKLARILPSHALDASLHAVQRPEQVHGRRPAGAQVIGDHSQLAGVGTPVVSLKPCMPRTTPIAAAMPMAGAPRTRRRRIASHTSSTVRQSR